MTSEQVKALIEAGEADNIERKKLIDLSQQKTQAEFILDMLSLANAHSDGPRYLLVGVNNDGSLAGIQPSEYDDARFQQVVNSRIEPPIQFSFRERAVDSTTIGIITIEQSVRRPHVVSKQLSDSKEVHLQQGDTRIKRGSSKVRPNAWDHMRFQETMARVTKQTPLLSLTFAHSAIERTPSVTIACEERQNDFDRFYCKPVSIALYVHNSGRALATQLIVDIILPDGCTVDLVQNSQNDGWRAVNYTSGIPRPPRFEGQRLNHGDFAFIGSVAVTFPTPPQMLAEIAYQLTWKILAAELPEPLTGELSILPSWQ